MVVPYTASAATIMYTKWFIVPLDQYRIDYSFPTGSAKMNLHFVSDSGTVYDLEFPGVPTGRVFLTCNGTYNLDFYDSAGASVGFFHDIVTTKIVNPPCNSYAGQTGQNDLNAAQTKNTDGTNTLNWSHSNGGTHTKVIRDGNEVYDGPETTYTGPDGSYTLIDMDDAGNITGRTDLNVPNYDGTGGTGGTGDSGSTGDTGGGSTCDGCKLLTDMLACPGWSQYMGDLTGAIKDALPPPPNWDEIADKIGAATINHLNDYLGPVPDAPSQTEIDSNTNVPAPALDTTVPGSDQLTPQVPPEYNAPQDFDIESGPQIEINDESKPFIIQNPLENVPHDEAGVPVMPGDVRNDANGIKNPETPVPIYNGVPVPVPGVPEGGAAPSNDPAPVPSNDPGTVPVDPMPTPAVTDGEIPIPHIPN